MDFVDFTNLMGDAVRIEFPPEIKQRRWGLSAFKEGWFAAFKGEPRECPYHDHRTVRGSVTFSRAYIRKWLAGYDACQCVGAGLTWRTQPGE